MTTSAPQSIARGPMTTGSSGVGTPRSAIGWRSYSLPQWNCTTTTSASCRARDALLKRVPVDRSAHAVETDEPELDAADVDHGDGPEPAREDSVLVQQLVGGGDAGRPIVGEVVVGEVDDLRTHQGQPVDEPGVTAEGEALRGAHRTARDQRRLQVDVRDVGILREIGGRPERPQEVVVVHYGGFPRDSAGGDDIAGHDHGAYQ